MEMKRHGVGKLKAGLAECFENIDCFYLGQRDYVRIIGGGRRQLE